MKNFLLSLFISLLFFHPASVVSAQEDTSNYFKFVTTKQLEFDVEFKKNIHSKTAESLNKEHKKFARWQWFWQNRIDEKGNLNNYYKELYSTKNLNHLKIKNINEVKNSTWKIIGPQKYPKGTNPGGIKGIGRIDAIVVNPNNDKHVIIGTRSGGIWETYNINDSIPTWQCLTNDLPITTVNDLKIVNKTLYASTSNKNQILVQGDGKYGLGIIKKKLKKKKWKLSNQIFESKKIVISKKTKRTLYAIGEKHVYKSLDAGNNWVKLTDPTTNPKLLLTNIEINPNNDDTIIVTGRLDFYYSTHNKKHDILIYKSENGGENWINLTTDLEQFINKKIKDVKAKDKPITLTTGLKNHVSTYMFNDTLFLCIQQMHNPYHVYFVTLNTSWRNFNLYNSLSKNNTYYYRTDGVDAVFQVINNNEILIGNRKLRIINNKNHSIKALDNNYKYLHQDIRAINYDSDINRLLIGTDGGINMNTKNTKRFSSFSNRSGNLNLFLAFNMSYINKKGVRTIRIGTQDTGYYKSDNLGKDWSIWSRFGSFGEGMIYTDPFDPTIVYRINAKGVGGNIHKSTNSGKTFKNPKIKAGNYHISPLEIDKKNTNNLIFDNYKNYDQYTLSLSNNQLDSAIFIDNGIEKLDKGMNLALALSEKESNIFYVARKKFHFKNNGINNSLFKSTNFDFNNPTNIKYIELTDNIKKLDSTILNNAFITHIELNKNNKNELWISFGNLIKGKKIFHSIDGGLHWNNLSKNLPNVPVNIIKYDAENKQLYIGNDYGVYSYNKITDQWNRYGNGLPIAMVTSIEIDNLENEIIASTNGRSVWIAPIIKNKDWIGIKNGIKTKN